MDVKLPGFGDYQTIQFGRESAELTVHMEWLFLQNENSPKIMFIKKNLESSELSLETPQEIICQLSQLIKEFLQQPKETSYL